MTNKPINNKKRKRFDEIPEKNKSQWKAKTLYGEPMHNSCMFHDGNIDELRKIWVKYAGCKAKIARHFKTDTRVLYKMLESYPKFVEDMNEAMNDATDQVEYKLFNMAKDGHYKSIELWLKNNRSDKYKDKKILEHAGDVGVLAVPAYTPKSERDE